MTHISKHILFQELPYARWRGKKSAKKNGQVMTNKQPSNETGNKDTGDLLLVDITVL